MNHPRGLDPVLDLQPTIRKYCELSPDRHALKNYRCSIEHLENPWTIVPASWAWLRRRLNQDYCTDLVSIGNCEHGQWWEDWDFVDYQ